MLLLCVDPGISTGVALLDSSGQVLSTYELSGDPDYIIDKLEQEEPTLVVIERGPAARANPYLDDLDAHLRAIFPDAHWMYPGEWKNTPRAAAPVEGVLSHHARDAVRMGREYLHTLEVAG